jgi:deazaflavin-dependent oxidoreductase (nitroreductase family)
VEGRDLLLLTTTGRKSGRSHTTPMVYTRDVDRLLVYASKGGAPKHPDWYLNLVADAHVVVEVGSERYDAIATPLEGEERDREFAQQVERRPQFGEYQQQTTRVIPGRRAPARLETAREMVRRQDTRAREAPHTA